MFSFIKRKLAHFIVGASLAFSLHCAPTDNSLESRCATDFDCPGETLCIDHLCQSDHCSTDYNCPGEQVCENNKCTSLNSVEKIMVGGILIKSGKTDAHGRVYFTDEQTGEEVTISAQDVLSKKGLEGTMVRFFDGKGFEAFLLEKPGYVVGFDVFSHNSEHEFHLFPGSYKQFTVLDHYFENNPEKTAAFSDYVAWAGDNYVYSGCYTKEELIKGRDDTLALLSYVFSGSVGLAGFYKVLSTVFEKILKLEEWGLVDTLPADVYHVYEPLNFTGPALYKGNSVQLEACDGLDNDCNKFIDDYCNKDRCVSHDSKSCIGNDIYWHDSCGNKEELFAQCDPPEKECYNGSCVSIEKCEPVKRVCADIYVMGELDSCGNIEKLFDCVSGETCRDRCVSINTGEVSQLQCTENWQCGAIDNYQECKATCAKF